MASFDCSEWNISDEVLRGIYCMGFEQPSAVQQKSIGPMLTSRDVVIQDRSGTGKTGAFLIALIEKIKRAGQERSPRYIVVCHTRELAAQTCHVAQSIAQFAPSISITLLIGGAPVPHNIELSQLIVATPGKLASLSSGGRPKLVLTNVEGVVIDEVDDILRQNGKNSCIDSVKEILSRVPPSAQIAFFSATISSDVKTIAAELLQDPVQVLMEESTLSVEGISQKYVSIDSAEDVIPSIINVLASMCSSQTMIFCATGDEAMSTGAALRDHQIECAVIYSGIGTEERQKEMQRFRDGTACAMVSTPVLSRGVDVQQVSLVILASVPAEPDTYLHSVGRCGRYGRRGTSVALARAYDMPTLRAVERTYGCVIEEFTT